MDRFKITYQGARDEFTFSVSSVLVRRATSPAPKGAEWKETADQWRVTVTEELYGNSVEFDYWMGIGNRSRGVPSKPGVEKVLYALGSDLGTALGLPPGDTDAMDYLADEFGHDGKPSDLLRQVHALRETVKKVTKLLANTGIDLNEFAQWASELEG